MNKIFIFTSIFISAFLINAGNAMRLQAKQVYDENSRLFSKDLGLKQVVAYRKLLPPQPPLRLSTAYGRVLNQIRLLESYSGTSMNVQLDNSPDSTDVSSQYEDTPYTGIHGLKVRVIVDKFAQGTDMGAVLDDIHRLEKNSDFMAYAINKDNDRLIVKGEIYGL